MRLSDLLADVRRRAPALLGDAASPRGARIGDATADRIGDPSGDQDPDVVAVVQDHTRVRPGALFVARVGARFDAHVLAAGAVRRGAVAVVGERDAHDPAGDGPNASALGALGVPYLRVPDARRVLPFLAAAVHGHPSEALRVLGVTGTDGKTTTSYLLHWLLSATHPTGLLSTAGIRMGDETFALEGHFTTPEAPEVQAFLAHFRDAGASHVVLESSSHGFALHRLDAVRYAVAAWTNLSPEHLDHHGTLEAYRDAKATLVRRAPRAVLNRDEPDFAYFAAAVGAESPDENDAAPRDPVVTYGAHPEADVRILTVEERPGALALHLQIDGARHTAALPMVGGYNAWNAAAAVAVARLEGVATEHALARLATFPGVPGRMQVVQAEPFSIVVDFAHTAPALEKALAAVRPAARNEAGGRVIVVVGAAGERDAGKRGPIGAAAVRHADLAVFTEEDSRSEPVAAILESMAEGARATGAREGEHFVRVPDRRAAIAHAFAQARPGDVVVLAGKGHEHTLERADEVLDWDEAAEARRIARAARPY
ncbi:MAG: UDP-N-acetylmuramoyl-L-alanyl-D-glutamate--2,6-diaminopimelate ligase [Trueperaceae bacterium]